MEFYGGELDQVQNNMTYKYPGLDEAQLNN